MTFRAGRLTAIMVDRMDASPYLNASDWSVKLATAETTHYGSVAKEFIPGTQDATVNFSGMFDATQQTAGSPLTLDALEDQLTASTGSGTSPITVCYDGGVAVGRRCVINNCIHTSYAIGTPVANVANIKVTATVSGRSGDGYVFTDGVALTTAVTQNYASVDNTASTANGGLAAFHVTANTWTGATTVKIQHSVDNSVWVDLVSQTISATTQVAYVPTVAGTVNRYLRAQVTTATGSGSITVVAAFARF